MSALTDFSISITRDKKFKIVVLGDQSVGKSCLISRFVFDSFQEEANPTIGVDFVVKTVPFGKENLKFHIWDTAGQERFHSLIPTYIKDCDSAIIVYDLNKQATFDNIDRWYETIVNEKGDDILLAIIGNKSDVGNREVTEEKGLEKAKSFKALFGETSAKTGEMVEDIFNKVISKLTETLASSKEAEGVNLGEASNVASANSNRKCC